jgi:hypothetical protein
MAYDVRVTCASPAHELVKDPLLAIGAHGAGAPTSLKKSRWPLRGKQQKDVCLFLPSCVSLVDVVPCGNSQRQLQEQLPQWSQVALSIAL